MAKKILIILVVFLVLGIGAYFAKDQILGIFQSKPSDIEAQALVKEAFLNTMNLNSTAMKEDIKIMATDLQGLNGSLDLKIQGKSNNLQTLPPELDLGFDLNIAGSLLMPQFKDGEVIEAKNNLQASTTGNIIFKDQKIYGRYDNVKISGTPELEMALPMLQLYANKWYSLNLIQMQAGLDDPTLLAQQTETQKQALAAIKELIQNYDLLTATVVKQNAEEYQISVGLNLDTIFSRDFLTAAKAAFEPTLLQSIENTKAQTTPEEYEAAKTQITGFSFDTMTDEDLANVKIIVSKVLSQVQGKYLITVSKTDKLIHSQNLNAVFDIAKITAALGQELPGPGSGKITLRANMSYSDINQAQTITVPTEDVVDLNSLMQPIPMETETDLEVVEPDPLLNLMDGINTGEVVTSEITPPMTDATAPVSIPVPRPR